MDSMTQPWAKASRARGSWSFLPPVLQGGTSLVKPRRQPRYPSRHVLLDDPQTQGLFLTRLRLRPTRFSSKSSRFTQGRKGSGRGNERDADEPLPLWTAQRSVGLTAPCDQNPP